MKVYISGPMTGYKDFNYPLFREVEQELFKYGLDHSETGLLEVCNPANNFNGDQTRPRAEYLDLAVKQVRDADALVLLPGWEQSEGAQLEIDTAKAGGKRFFLAVRHTWAEYSRAWLFVEYDVSPDTTRDAGQFETKDSGQREEWPSGMLREPSKGKTRFDLLFPVNQPYDKQMFVRFAELMTRGAAKYAVRNWETANTPSELAYFRESAIRHFFQWYLNADTIEDHAAAVFFNIMGAEYTADRLNEDFNAEFHRGNL